MNYQLFDDDFEVDIQLLVETGRRKKLIRAVHQQFSIKEEIATYLVCFNNVKTAEDVLLLLTTQNGQMQHVFAGSAELCEICQYAKDQHIQELIQRNEFGQVTQFFESSEGKQFKKYLNEQVQTQNCQICYETFDINEMTKFDDQIHDICRQCFHQFLVENINQGKVMNFFCPHCNKKIEKEVIQTHISPQDYQKLLHIEKSIKVASDPTQAWCPNNNCQEVIVYKGSDQKVQCGKCEGLICWKCKRKWHNEKKCNEVVDIELQNWQMNRDTQQCPKCKMLVEKAQGCNHLTCFYCRHEWCWICGATYSSFHFAIFNPIGCPGLMPGLVKQKDWNICKLTLWRFLCLLMLLIITPILVCIAGPLISMLVIKKQQWFRRASNGCKIVIVTFGLIVGILLEPVFVSIFVIGILPVTIILISYYIKERQSLNERHNTMMQERNIQIETS